MPNMNGLQAALILRQLLPVVPIVLFTLHVGSVLEKEAKASGITSIVSKNHFPELLREVSAVLTH